MNIRRLVLDVDKAVSKPTIPELAEAICQVAGVVAITAQPLLDLALQHPVDVVEGLVVVESFARMGIEGHIAMVVLAERYRTHAVRETAK